MHGLFPHRRSWLVAGAQSLGGLARFVGVFLQRQAKSFLSVCSPNLTARSGGERSVGRERFDQSCPNRHSMQVGRLPTQSFSRVAYEEVAEPAIACSTMPWHLSSPPLF